MSHVERSWIGDHPVGRFHTWWRGDPLPVLPALPGLAISQDSELHLTTQLHGLTGEEAAQRAANGHRLWQARVGGELAGWGWSASQEFSVGELGISRVLPAGNRYLWDFFTLPAWRGQGIYPRLLQAIVTRETDADRFWLGHDLDNEASRRGIIKSGFQETGLLTRQPDGAFGIIPTAPLDRSAATSALFGYPLASHREPGS